MSNGRLTLFNTILAATLAVLFGFLIRNVHQNAVRLAHAEAIIERCCNK